MSLLGRMRRMLLPDLDLLHLQRRRVLRLVAPGARVLDAGCGRGEMVQILEQRGCDVLGVTNDPVAATASNIRVHDLATDGPPGEGFDAALCLDVLEHIAADRAALQAIAESLRSGGRLLLTVPNIAAPTLPGDTVSKEQDGGHVRAGYSRDDLANLLADAGLQPVGCRAFGGFVTQKAMNVARRLERHPGRLATAVRILWLIVLRPLTVLDPLIPWPSYAFFVIAERP